MNRPHIEPCPFCGGRADFGCGNSCYGRFWYSVGCDACDVWLSDREEWDENGKLKLPELECVVRWNKRPALKEPEI